MYYIINIVNKKRNAPSLDISYAGFWKRFDALSIDLAIILLISFILFALLTFVSKQNAHFQIILEVILVAYNVFFITKNGATPGKRLLKLKVVTKDLKKPSFAQVLLREVLGRVIDTFTFCIGNVASIFNKKKRTLHDVIAGTYVIDDAKNEGA